MTTTSKIPTITSDELTAKVLELATKYPHATYSRPEGRNQCSYIEGEVTGTDFSGCIFGIALRELGVPTEFFERLEEEDDSSPGIFQVARRLRIPFKEQWHSAQRVQDKGKTWNQAAGFLKEV